jgi:hypothetical protein
LHTRQVDLATTRQLAEMIVGGVPAPCPRCGGRVKYVDGRYRCTNWVDPYARCQFRAAAHTRRPFALPSRSPGKPLNCTKVGHSFHCASNLNTLA